MGTKRIDETGKRYGRLTVLRYYGTEDHYSFWLCRCDCGREVAVRGAQLRRGKTKSCGCLLTMTQEERDALGYGRCGRPPKKEARDGR